MEILGNLNCQTRLGEFLTIPDQTIALVGPSHLGKFGFSELLVERTIDSSDYLIMEDNLDGVRQVSEFCMLSPFRGQHRVILIDNVELLSEPAQDALLKITEEPRPGIKLILISNDLGHLQPPLRSRIRNIVRWVPLNDDEMRSFAGSLSSVVCESLLTLSCGLPGIYKIMVETPGFEELFHHMCEILSGKRDPLLDSAPILVKDLKSSSPYRDALIHIMRVSAKKFLNSRSHHVLKFCSVLGRHQSINSEIHWFRMASHFSNVE